MRRNFLASRFSSLSNVDVDVAGLGEDASDSGEIRRGRKRKVSTLTFYELSSYVIKLGNDDAKHPGQPERTEIMKKLRPRGDKHPKAKTDTRKLRGKLQRTFKPTGERSSVPDDPELLQHPTAKPNELNVAAGDSLVPEPGMLSCLDPNTTRSVERAPKRRSTMTTKSARKRRPTVRNTLPSCPTDPSQTPEKIIEGGTTTDLDHGMDHTAAKVHGSHIDEKQSPPALTCDNARADVLEDEVHPDGCTLSEYPVLSSIGVEKERHVGLLPRPPLPVKPPIWAQVRWIICEKNGRYMVPSLDRKCASLLTTSGAIKVASIIPMTLSKDIFLGPTPPGWCTLL
jgi:hypothetical protein